MKNSKTGANKASNVNTLIKVRMFGGFSISEEDAEINDGAMRTHQLWHLIQYLITFRRKTISQEELIEVLWPDNEIENPTNALKNLIYRVRSTFIARGIPHAREMIVYNKGGYQWNNELDCVVDTERFEELFKKASDENIPTDTRISSYKEAIELYTGDFLPGSRYEKWVVPISSYYRSLYFQCVYAVINLLSEKKLDTEIIKICEKALEIDRFEENAHIHLMLAMASQGRRHEALVYYGRITDMFFRDLGVSPSEMMRYVYTDLAKTEHDSKNDLNVIKETLKEDGKLDGAFFCEYEVFKNLYRIEARTASRSGQAVFLCLLGVESEHTGEPLDLKIQGKLMDSLFETVKGNLRKGDVFSRYSASQYILILPTLTYENCEMVMNRIVKKYKQGYKPKGVAVNFRIQHLEPVDM